MRRLVCALAGLVVAALAGPARCDSPPYDTTDLDIADGLQLGLVTSQARDDGGDLAHESLEIGIPVAPRWELDITPTYAWSRRQGVRRGGPGDTEAEFKILALAETAARPAFGFNPTVVLPTGRGRDGLGEGVFQVELPVVATKGFGPYRLTAQAAYARSGSLNHAPMSVLFEHSLGQRLRLGAEVMVDPPLGRGPGLEAEVNLGGVWQVTRKVALHAVIGHGLAGGEGLLSRIMLAVAL
jgi:hypothetical protein